MQKKTAKALRKLDRKKELVAAWLKSGDVKVDDDVIEVLKAGYVACGKTLRIKSRTIASLHAHYGNVMAWAGLNSTAPKSAKRLVAKATTEKAFYKSYDWRRVRYDILKRDGGRCQLCGVSAADGAVLNVDHIRPLKKYWALRLDPDNLQTLCGSCNHGKGNRDETDWREPDVRALMGERLH